MIEDILIYICVSWRGFTAVGRCHRQVPPVVSFTDWVLLQFGRVIASNGRSSFGPSGIPVNLWAHSICGKGPHPLLWAGSRAVHGKIIWGASASASVFVIQFNGFMSLTS